MLDLGDVTRQAAKLEAAAQAKAARIEQAARDNAVRMTENAHAEGFKQGHAAGLEAGAAQGRAQGRDEVFSQAQPELTKLQETWSQAAGKLKECRNTVEREARQSVLELAMRLAEKIVHRTVQVDQTVIVDQVAAALTHALGGYDVTVRISPDDRPTLEAALPKLVDEFSRFEHIKLVEDADIGRGGCFLSFGQGQVDATLDAQLCRVVELLLPEPENSVPTTEQNLTQPADKPDQETDDDAGDVSDPTADTASPEPAKPSVTTKKR